jgi:hypothetical protein
MILLIIFFVTPSVVAGSDFDLSGSFKSSTEYLSEDKELIDRERLNLEFKKEFSFNSDMLINLDFNAFDGDTDIDFKEAYLNYYANKIDWRIGKQIINWGSSYKLKPSNYFNPNDLKALKIMDSKLGIKAIKANYYPKNKMEITGIVIPFFESNIDNDIEDRLENIQAGIKVTRRGFKNSDISFSVYHGFEKNPIFTAQKTEFPEVDKLGFDLITDFLGMGFWTECSYSKFEKDNYKNYLAATIGADYKFDNDLYLVAQFSYLENRSNYEKQSEIFNLHFEKPVFNFHQLEALIIYELESETFVCEPQFTYSISEGLDLEIGIRYVDSKHSGLKQIYDFGEDRIYCQLEWKI